MTLVRMKNWWCVAHSILMIPDMQIYLSVMSKRSSIKVFPLLREYVVLLFQVIGTN